MEETCNRQLNVGVIGAGWWATAAHLPAILEHPRATLLAVQSRDKAKAERIKQDFGAYAAMSSYHDLLDMKGLDAVIISTTPNMHYLQARAALEKGKHVLIEKPMTFTAAEASELCQLADENELQLLISCPWHYTLHSIEARRLIHSGKLGDIRLISILMSNPIDKLLNGINTTPTHDTSSVYVEPNAGSYSDPNIAGGGQIYCQVSHVAAYIAFLTGLRASEVYAKFNPDNGINDIYDAMTITLQNGALCNICSSAATPAGTRSYEVRLFGTGGVLFLELWQGRFRFVPFEGKSISLPDLKQSAVYPERAPALNFINTILGLEPNGSEGWLGLAAMEIIDAACQSAKSGQPVSVHHYHNAPCAH